MTDNIIRFPIERTKAAQEAQRLIHAYAVPYILVPRNGKWEKFIPTGEYVATPPEDEAF